MNVNFFGWIRDGVKQSVLLGVSDAIETIGSPADTSAMHPSILAIMDKGNTPTASERLGSNSTPDRNAANEMRGRKRLGRSLKDINPLPAEGSGS